MKMVIFQSHKRRNWGILILFKTTCMVRKLYYIYFLLQEIQLIFCLPNALHQHVDLASRASYSFSSSASLLFPLLPHLPWASQRITCGQCLTAPLCITLFPASPWVSIGCRNISALTPRDPLASPRALTMVLSGLYLIILLFLWSSLASGSFTLSYLGPAWLLGTDVASTPSIHP